MTCLNMARNNNVKDMIGHKRCEIFTFKAKLGLAHLCTHEIELFLFYWNLDFIDKYD